MALKLSLKPGERLIIGNAVISNANGRRCELCIENNVPLLREKDIFTENDADTPCKRIYLSIQLMYIDEKNQPTYHNTYWQLVRETVHAAPSTLPMIDKISEQIVTGRYYQALKLARQLIEYEREVIASV